MSKRCVYCGHFNADEAKICKTCGISLEEKKEKIKDISFVDNNRILLSVLFIFFIPILMFAFLGSYEFFQTKYIIISTILILLGFIIISRGIYKDPYNKSYRVMLIVSTAFTIFVIPLVYFITSIEIVA